MSRSKVSPTQRSALVKLSKGYKLAQSWGGRVTGPPIAWFPDYYDNTAFEKLGKRYGDKYVHMSTFHVLLQRQWIERIIEDLRGSTTYVITQAGREALNET